jgi:hypothetical protein
MEPEAGMTRKRMWIFIRAFSLVLLTTTNIYLISNHMYVMAILIGIGISTMWTLNVRDLSISGWEDRLYYIVGGATGTTVALYVLPYILRSLR